MSIHTSFQESTSQEVPFYQTLTNLHNNLTSYELAWQHKNMYRMGKKSQYSRGKMKSENTPLCNSLSMKQLLKQQLTWIFPVGMIPVVCNVAILFFRVRRALNINHSTGCDGCEGMHVPSSCRIKNRCVTWRCKIRINNHLCWSHCKMHHTLSIR